ncbi:MAG: PKD domain-containing protein, partial [Rhodoferax sp.]
MWTRFFLVSLVLAGLGACGGGSGGSSSGGGGGVTPEPPANVAPVANAGANQTVTVGDSVQLTGSGSDANGDTLTYSWT